MRPSPLGAVAVVVPVHDEEGRLAECLTSIHEACARISLPSVVIVVADACTDTSSAIAHGSPPTATVFTEDGNVGVARRTGLAHAMDGCALAGDRLWLATTDADSQVPADWLAQQIDGAEHGDDVHVGTVDLDAHLERAFPRWAGPMTDHHPYVHGANLGVRASAYGNVGGFPSIASHEDRVLVARLSRSPGIVVHRARELPVRTSWRTDGRAPDGVAADLRRLRAR